MHLTLSFLREYFDKEETVLHSMRKNDRSEDEEAVFFLSPCLIAKDKSSKKIIAVNQLLICKNPKFNDSDDGVSAVFANNAPKTKLMQKYFKFECGFNDETNLYQMYPDAKTAVECFSVAVDKDHRKKGLATTLLAEGVSFARSIDAGFIFGQCTSEFSRKAAEKLGFRSVWQVDLLKEKDEGGNPVFQDTPPHNIISIHVLKL
ncbi:arylalkylamine N-acetyltransferase 1 [Halictus rubicundus]|uniref:arylalkylamine N-acetyltransferase 1 n=1 Tax=Halictus rubicundus TaxID=77578 RepID=UPI004035DEFA